MCLIHETYKIYSIFEIQCYFEGQLVDSNFDELSEALLLSVEFGRLRIRCSLERGLLTCMRGL